MIDLEDYKTQPEEYEEMERDRIIEIIKSHIGNTYPINCKAIIKEIKETSSD